MSYASNRNSEDNALPEEFFYFTTESKEYFYTTSPFETDFNGDTYYPCAIIRERYITGTSRHSDMTTVLKIPVSCDIVKHYQQIIPGMALRAVIWRRYAGDQDASAQVLLKGPVTSIITSGIYASFRVSSSFSSVINGEIPSMYYQSVCNHALYDSGCKVVKTLHATENVVSGYSETGIRLETPVTSGDFNGGEVSVKRTGETRQIISGTGNQITISSPFADIKTGDDITMYKGCDHSSATCRDKFNNYENFGGFLSIPGRNPFNGDLF